MEAEMIGFREVRGILCLVIVLACAGALATVGAQESPDDAKAESALALETRALFEDINDVIAENAALKEQLERAVGEEQLLLERRRMSKSLEALSDLDTAIENVLALENRGEDVPELRASAVELVAMIAPVARERIEELQAEIASLASEREVATGEDLVDLENEIAADGKTLDLILDKTLQNVRHMEELGLDAAEDSAHLASVLTERAETTRARVQLSLEQIAALNERLAEKPDDADLKTELAAVEAKRDRGTKALDTTIEMMKRLGLETTDYREFLIESTGQITADILDTEVALGLFGQWMERLRTWMVESGPTLFFRLVVFVLILFVFHLLAKLARKVVRKAVSTSKLNLSQLLQKMFVNTAGNVVWIVGILVALSQLGFALGPLLAGLGIAGFIVGFALQETLGNFAAGMMILIYRPYDVGDLVEVVGVFGRVSAMSMVSTTVLTLDHQTLVIPNGKIWGDVIKNVTAQKVRRVDMVFGISYSDDIPKTEKILEAILAENPKVLDDPEPMVRLHTLNDSSVDFVVRPWCNTDDYWDVYWAVTREVKMRFDREGVSIPFPQRDVHLYEEKRIASTVQGPGESAA
jgi:small conductance mechanosensitive channel